jgi:predicted nucleotidyltransferase component of viral defense system
MISIENLLKYYPESLHPYKSFILREYLQYKILEIVFNSTYGNKLSFLGGTCLRLVHGNDRFSEDIDFDNFNLSEEDFEEISKTIKTQLERQGYTIEIKNVYRGAFHCYIRFPKLLYDYRLTGHAEQKILIQLDTEPHNYSYTPENFILNQFDVFTPIKITPREILLSQKIYALINRNRKKGRDFYDVVFLLKNTRPDYSYLELKLGIHDKKSLKERILKVCEDVDLNEMARDVQPFLFKPEDARYIILFPDYIHQIL